MYAMHYLTVLAFGENTVVSVLVNHMDCGVFAFVVSL